MAIRIKSRAGESTEGMLRRFKKMCEKEGLTKDVKRKAFFEKPSERKRRSLRKSIKRTQMAELGILPKGKRGPGGPGGPGMGRDGPGGPPVY
jgi:small subunit ribosomal protein S21